MANLFPGDNNADNNYFQWFHKLLKIERKKKCQKVCKIPNFSLLLWLILASNWRQSLFSHGNSFSKGDGFYQTKAILNCKLLKIYTQIVKIVYQHFFYCWGPFRHNILSCYKHSFVMVHYFLRVRNYENNRFLPIFNHKLFNIEIKTVIFV